MCPFNCVDPVKKWYFGLGKRYVPHFLMGTLCKSKEIVAPFFVKFPVMVTGLFSTFPTRASLCSFRVPLRLENVVLKGVFRGAFFRQLRVSITLTVRLWMVIIPNTYN